MKNLLLIIIGLLLLFPSISKAANDEIVWEFEGYGIGNLIASNTKNTFISTNKDYVLTRNFEDGSVIDSINFKDYFKYINKISITDDDRYLAVSGDGPFLIIWDLEKDKEFKRYTAKITDEADEYLNSKNYWTSASLSPDGRKICAILKNSFSDYSRLMVFDIESNDTLMNKLRNLWGQTKYDITSAWVSTEFSPNGEYLVAQLDVRNIASGDKANDSLLVYNTNPLTLDKVIINSYFNPGYSKKEITYSSTENYAAYFGNNPFFIYNLKAKEINLFSFERESNSVLFSNTDASNLMISLGTRVFSYDISTEKEIYNYENNFSPLLISKDDSKVIGYSENGIICLNTFWIISTVENNSTQSILYPNPVNSLLKINFNAQESANFKYDLFDINSNRMIGGNLGYLVKGGNTTEINMQQLTSQTYYLKIYSPYESYNFKIVKGD